MNHTTVLGVLLALLAAAVGGGCSQPARHESDTPPGALTWPQEAELGRKAAPGFEKALGGQSKDLAIQAYVRSVGERISRCTSHPDLPYQFAVLDTEAVDVFALPGGPVYVTRGLAQRLSTEGELAAVLAHGMGHINLRHAAQELSRRMGTPAVLAAMAAPASRAPDGAFGDAGSMGKIVGLLLGLKYTPEQEGEVDRLGLDYMVAAGYDPAQMVRLLDRLEAPAGAKPVGWQGSHPSPGERVEAARKMIEEKYPSRRGRVADEEYKREVLQRLAKPQE